MPRNIIPIWEAQKIARQYAAPDSGLARFALYRELDGPIISELQTILRRKRAGVGDVRQLYAYVCDALCVFAENGIVHPEFALLPAAMRDDAANVA